MLSSPVTDANSLLLKVDSFFNVAVWVLISLSILFVVWNVVQFIRHAASDDRKTYQNGILWGIVGLAVILSIWGLVNILGNTFGLGNSRGGQVNASNDINALMFQRGSGTSGGINAQPSSGATPNNGLPAGATY